MLSPFRVLDLSDHRGQLCGQILGDLGADVILIEPPGGSSSRALGPFADDSPGPERSLNFLSFNRNKRSITLDIESSEGKARLLDLVRSSDFLIESFPAGYMDGLGLGYEELSEVNPRLVMVSITPFGQTGPRANWAASDLTLLASSGVLQMTGDDDRPPCRVAVPQAFLHGAGEAAAGALIAHLGRERDGVGQHVDVSSQSAAMMATQYMVLSSAWNEQPVVRVSGGLKLGPITLRLVNPAKDGFVSVTFLFGSAIGPFSRRLMEVMHEEGFVDEATRDKDWLNYTVLLLSGQEPVSELQRCIESISRWTQSHTKQELFDLALERGLLIVPVATVEDLVESPQLEFRQYWQSVTLPQIGRDVIMPGPFAKFSRTPIRYRLPPPRMGEHNEEIAAERRDPAPATARAGAGSSARKLPLDGVKVADFMWVVAGPAATRTLADFGATVVRVESASSVDTIRTIQPFLNGEPGPERSGAYASAAANKYGLTLNMSSPEGRATAKKLAAWADVVTESFAPGAMKRWGLDYESIREVNPDVIMISSCLNGQTGPQSSLAGFGTMGAQLAGFGDLAGWPDRPPAGPFGAYTDYIAPKISVCAILASLEHRRRTGEGQYIDFSQSESSFQYIGPALLEYTVNGRVATRNGNASLDYSPHGVFPAAGEDRWVAIVAETDEQFRGLATAIGKDDWLSDPALAKLDGRLARSGELEAAISAWTRSRDPQEIEVTLQEAGVPVYVSARSVDALADPQLAARGHFATVEHPEHGPVTLERARITLSATPSRLDWPGPTFGQHNEIVLREFLGLSDEEAVELIAAGALE